jgi:hypothetical protein
MVERGKVMDKYPLLRKGLAVGIILLFVGVTIAPAINANDDKIVSKPFSLPKNEDMIPITVMEYRPDGTIGKSVVKLSKIQVEKLRTELKNAKDLDIRLSICKKYNLIPQNVTIETLRLGMNEKALEMGITQNKLECMVKNEITNYQTLSNKSDYMNLLCTVDGYGYSRIIGGFHLIPFGSSIFTIFYNGLNRQYGGMMHSFDFYDLLIGTLWFYSSGILGSFSGKFHGIIRFVGFVGIMYYFNDFWTGFMKYFIGSAVFVRATSFIR